MIVVIGGPPGSGKTTVATGFAKAHGYVLVSAGEAFRKLARDRGMDLEAFSREAERDHEIDRSLDRAILEEILRRGANADVVVDGRIQAPLLVQRRIPCVTVWIDAPLRVRAQRIAGRERQPVEVVEREIRQRERSERTRYRALYGIDLNDKGAYELVIDSSDKTPDEIIALVAARVGR